MKLFSFRFFSGCMRFKSAFIFDSKIAALTGKSKKSSAPELKALI
jgi:hypothetical protein